MSAADRIRGRAGGGGALAVGDRAHRFEKVAQGRLRLLVREDVAEPLPSLLRQWSAGTLPAPRPVAGGRGGAGIYDAAADLAVVLRHSRRGGRLSRVNPDVYFGLRPRPFRELRVAEILRSRGVPTTELLGAAVRWLGPGWYRGAVVSLYVDGSVNLWQYLRTVSPAERGRVCRAAALATRRLHDAGAVHPDLNLQNYLVCRRGSEEEVLIIDCDRVRLCRVSSRYRSAAFARLCRSIRRLDPQSAVITLDCVEALRSVEQPGSALSAER